MTARKEDVRGTRSCKNNDSIDSLVLPIGNIISQKEIPVMIETMTQS